MATFAWRLKVDRRTSAEPPFVGLLDDVVGRYVVLWWMRRGLLRRSARVPRLFSVHAGRRWDDEVLIVNEGAAITDFGPAAERVGGAGPMSTLARVAAQAEGGVVDWLLQQQRLVLPTSSDSRRGETALSVSGDHDHAVVWQVARANLRIGPRLVSSHLHLEAVTDERAERVLSATLPGKVRPSVVETWSWPDRYRYPTTTDALLDQLVDIVAD